MSHLAEPLVGRGAELAALDDALGAARRGFVALEVVGEPGMGKTRLLAELEQRADAQGCLVLTGSASELERDLPFGVFVDALDEYLHGLEPRRLANLDDATRAELAHIFPSLEGRGAGNDERYRLHRAARALLEELAGPKPLVLILDDLHWADSGSLELLGSLLRRPPAAPVLLALAVRPRQVPERLVAALERVRQIALGELTPAEARELVGEHAEKLYPAAGGNPFYLQQLARAPERLATGPAVPLSGVDVPRAVAAAFAGEIAQLSDNARRSSPAPRSPATRSSPSWPRPPPGSRSGTRSTRSTSSCAATSSATPTSRAASASATRSCARRSTRPRSAAGGWSPTSAARRRCGARRERPGARAPRRALRPPRRRRRGRGPARGGRRPRRPARPPRRHGSTAPRCGCSPRTRAERPPLLAAQAVAFMAAGQWVPAYEAIREALALAPSVPAITAAAALEHLLGRHREAHARLETALAELPAGSARTRSC